MHTLQQSIPLKTGLNQEILPTSTATVFMKRCYSAPNQKELNFVPYFGDDEGGEKASDAFDKEAGSMYSVVTLQNCTKVIYTFYRILLVKRTVQCNFCRVYQW